MLPQIIDEKENQNPDNIQRNNEAVDNSFKELLQSLRQDQTPKIRKKRTKVNVKPGKSIGVEDFFDDDENLNPQTSLSSDPKPCSSKQVQPNKSRKRVDELSSSEDDDDFSVEDSDSSNSPDLDESTDRPSGENLVINEGDYMLVKVHGKTKASFRCYICKVGYLEDDGFVGTFLKRVQQTNKFTITEEESLVSRNDFILKLSSPVFCSSARFKDMIFFKDDLSDFTIY
ncbi:hypothetical protein RI129_012148 [Pyrocoelia pectoralis]|uniref:Uncharacterized protein n=1 Tax=Pyrocoelia pectoralis TaxID=417401 RepID=A0AAN7V678_9COLE